ncbi:MAG: Coenzyme F420:L-glutamate ligase [Methanonatronarchaeales archaeon]|nr:Coenzyme F420:L-glutamate ligase [Methanonatronarchaeales archaeon]
MDLLEAVHTRRSVRAFRDEPVPGELLERVLDAARQAPTAGNLQAWSVAVVEDAGTQEGLAMAALGQGHVAGAPVDLVFVADGERSAAKYGERGRTLYALQDATIAATHAVLAAHALGLGTCWVGAMREGDVEGLLGVPDGHRVVAIIPMGYPADGSVDTSRRPLESFLHSEGW